MVAFEPFRLELRIPLETARGRITQRRGLLVSLEYDGQIGVGESTPLPGWTESYEECRDALEQGQIVADNLDWGIALARMDAPAARHGLSLALLDSRARIEDTPMYHQLGTGQSVECVPVNATLGADQSPERIGETALGLVEQGYDCLKVKAGTMSVETDLERVRAVRNAVGPDISVRADANGAWTKTEADEALSGLAALAVEYVEQPLPAGALDELADLRSHDVDIALDESLIAHEIETILAHDAADVVVLKPMVLGGPDRTVATARTAREAGVEPVVSTTVDGVVARTGAVHVAAAIPDVRPCGLATGQFLATDLAPDPAPVENGSIRVPQSPGLGFDPSHFT